MSIESSSTDRTDRPISRGKLAELFFVADRGVLKIYTLDRNHSPTLRLAEEVRIPEATARMSERFSDQAGAFPTGGTAGQGNSMAERQNLTAENEARSFRRISTKIADVLEHGGQNRWSFAAPAEIDGAILDGIPAHLKNTLHKKVRKDLVNIPDHNLLGHFQSA